jgi:hypothetical protein
MNKTLALCIGAATVLVSGFALMMVSLEPLDGNSEKHAMSKTISLLSVIGPGIEKWSQSNGTTPATSAGLTVLELDSRRTNDGWGRPLIYQQDNSITPPGFKLYSAGPDGIDSDGLGDDVKYRGTK